MTSTIQTSAVSTRFWFGHSLMAEGYGFGAEGDWKTACPLLHTLGNEPGLGEGLLIS